MKKKISVAPIHYVLSSKDTGSEFSWANNYYFRLQKNTDAVGLDITFTTGGTSNDLKMKKNIISLDILDPEIINLSIRNLLLFYLRLHLSEFKSYFRNKPDIHHHFLPFHIDRSFNLIAPFARNFVVGPIQSKLEVLDTDLSAKDARGFKGDNFLSKLANSLLLKVILPTVNGLNYLTLKSAKKIIVINQYTKMYLVKRGIREDRIIIIPPGIDTKKYSLAAKPRVIGDTVKLLVVGYMLNRKRMDLAIETIKLLRDKHHIANIRLTIAGDGPQKDSLHKLVDEYSLKEYVKFAGFIPNTEINKYYAKSDILLNFSQAEGFATVCLEALASGMITISTPVGGFINAIKNSENGYIVGKSNAPIEAAEIIAKIIDQPQIATKISQNAIITAKSYDWDGAIIPKYISVYRSL